MSAPIEPPETTDFPAYGEEERNAQVLRVRTDRGKYTHRYLNFDIGYLDPDSEHNYGGPVHLEDCQHVTLQRAQVIELAQHLNAWLGAW